MKTSAGGGATGNDLTGEDERATRWLSRGLEELIRKRAAQPPSVEPVADFDVVVVGSGYGGAVAAAELCAMRGDDKTVCVLERGREYLQGHFPTRMADVAAHVRFAGGGTTRPKGYREGLFDVRIGADVSVLVGNGLGGGSLINAGVMLMPEPDVFADAAWPAVLREQPAIDGLMACSAELRERLGATHTMTSDGVQGPAPHKFGVLGRLSPGHFGAVPITVALADGTRSSAGVPMDACVRCGDCATGCNHNAKLSLDVTLLAEAVRHGAQVFAGATVLRIEKSSRADGTSMWLLHLVHTDADLRRRQGGPFILRAGRVVLAAGTLGSTEILMRSQSERLRFSARLGQSFSANGDMIAAACDTEAGAVDCVGDETVAPADVALADRPGPTITGLIDLRRSDVAMAIQDLGVPGALRRLFEEVVTTAASLHLLGEGDERTHGAGDAVSNDPCAIDAERMRRSLLVVMMSRDTADGLLTLDRRDDSAEAGDGALSVHWPRLRDHPPFLAQHAALQDMLDRSAVKGRVLPNPMWRPLPTKLDYLFEGATGPLLTVHPLGGCPMGDSVMSGVVDALGRVFDPSAHGTAASWHDGLVVLDGSVIPTSLGINPALTIASVALRAVRQLAPAWGFTQPAAQTPLPARPRFRAPPARTKPQPTVVEVLERLSGPVTLKSLGREVHAELTMHFEPIALRQLMVPGAALRLEAARGRLRILDRPGGVREDTPDDDPNVLLVAEVCGSLRVLHQEPSTPWQRRVRSLSAWVRNRGLRDTVLWLQDRILNSATSASGSRPFLQEAGGRIASAWQLGSRAGAVRLMDYDLSVVRVLRIAPGAAHALREAQFTGQPIRGAKRLTYARRANPWRQLMNVKLSAFPDLSVGAGADVLRLDPAFLARQGMPLLRIVRQQDQPNALVDMASLGLYVLRMLLHVHVWSFRAPDKPLPREIRRLPGAVRGLPEPSVTELAVGAMDDGRPIMVRLTHYPFGPAQRTDTLRRNPASRAAVESPVLLIHGYSASGTTFAHHAVRPNLASALWDAGRDVWIVDMRTSAGMPHAQYPWRFEEVARADIPVAIGHVLASTGKDRIDVFAHCMGSAMLGMALLGPQHPDESFWPQRQDLHTKIRALVISQVPPAMIFTPDNVLRAYVMRYVSHYLSLDGFQFRVSDTPGLAEQLADRLLATLPYPESEFDRENPLWTPWRRTPWVGTRHRMDALYGRDFSLNNVSDDMLAHIDDHFGPLSLQTVSQVIHFARFRAIANAQGFNEFVDPAKLLRNYDFPVLCVHGEENGLVSVDTLAHFEGVMQAATGRTVATARFAGFGHQDCLVGTQAVAVFDEVIGFLDGVADTSVMADGPPPQVYACDVPSLGLRLDITATGAAVRFSVGDDGGRGRPLCAVFMPVAWVAGRACLVTSAGIGEPTVSGLAETAVAVMVPPVEVQDWEDVEQGASGDNMQLPFSVDRSVMPSGADGLLVMLVYGQPPVIGEPLALARGLRAPDDAASLSPAMLAALLSAWHDSSDALLESGLLRLPQSLTDRPADDGPGEAADRCFVLASCQYPGGMLDRTPPGMPREALAGPSDASYLRIRERLDAAATSPSFLVLAGDQVYVDATAGLFDARNIDDQFRLPYESFLGARGPRSVLGRLPAYMVMDDHEIVDNWEADPIGATPRRPTTNAQLRARGRREFRKYQRPWDFEPADTASLFRRAELAGLPFFFADSRLERLPRLAADAASADMMGAAQAEAIAAWLAEPSFGRPRFFVSSSMVLPRLLESRSSQAGGNLRSDAWDGYPVALHRLLAGVYERGAGDVVFLSGDEHRGNVTRIVLTRADSERRVVAHSVHCPALYAPYPFANAVAEDFARRESFEFDAADSSGVQRRYRCDVRSWFPPPGDGFALLRLQRRGRGWRVSVEFDRARPEGGAPNGIRSFVVR